MELRHGAISFLGCVAVIFLCAAPHGVQSQCTVPGMTTSFLDRIFAKYGTVDGSNSSLVLNVDGLERLMQKLSLGNVSVVCQENDIECLKNKYKRHGVKDPLIPGRRRRKRRGAGGDDGGAVNPKDAAKHDIEWRKHLDKCLGSNNVSAMFKMNDGVGITKQRFLNICPALVQQIDARVCMHYHKRFPKFVDPDGPPSSSESWGYGFLAITICSFLSLGVIVMIPCLGKSFYNYLMAYLVALAVGTLAGDAMLHLIPHAFIEGANLSAGIVVDKTQRLQQHYSQVWRAMFVLLGIYLFFCVEQFMKLKGTLCCKGAHTHDVPMVDTAEEETGDHDHDHEEGLHSHGAIEKAGGGHGHSHGAEKNITEKTAVSSVAWMVIVGDGFHNFSDGLAVGAAFSASISSGVSTTIAIFCHELPHELGDFAILLKSGMTVRQAIVYNLVSTILAYIGLALGIVAGTGELGRHIILSMTAGLFLYISLVDMMKEITDGEEGVATKLATVVCQHAGLLSGIGIMLFISLYEHNM